jgi:protein-S-isoprenylcysteine O-methyltransferase Ste14
MEFLPEMQLGWLNGWLPLAGFYAVFGVLMLVFPRAVVLKLYDISGWSRAQFRLSLAGKPFALASLALIIFTPLKLGQPVFWIGGGLFVLGYVGMLVALFNYAGTPADQPVEKGLYRYSRNPQWLSLLAMLLGSAIAVGSGLAVGLLLVAAGFYHFRILGEERSCLARYGESYRAYLQRVPRYLGLGQGVTP